MVSVIKQVRFTYYFTENVKTGGLNMTDTNIYRDIALRTGADIYIGVVGPVRTGKSTFIKNHFY